MDCALLSRFVKSYNSEVFPYATTDEGYRQSISFALFGIGGHLLVFLFYLFHIWRVYRVDVVQQVFLTLRHTRYMQGGGGC